MTPRFEQLESREMLTGTISTGHDNIPLFGEDGTVLVSGPLAAATGGDFNADGRVDAADYTVWRDNFPEAAEQFELWKANFGKVTTLEDVRIPAGETVTVSGLDASARNIYVEGTLRFNPAVDTLLAVETILVAPGGLLEITPEAGHTAEIVFKDTPFSADDPEQFSHGLISLGTVLIEGAAKTPYANQSANVQAGRATIQMANIPADWQVGDVIMLADSSKWGATQKYQQRETRKIAAISGNTITVDRDFAYAHEAVKDYLGNVVAYAPIANLTRSVTLKSENPAGIRGHALFTDYAITSLKFAAFEDMGRTKAAEWVNSSVVEGETVLWQGTNQNGRYPVHLHHSHHAAVVGGCVVDGSPKWGLAIHNTNANQIIRNVLVDCIGAGIVTEQGTERDNRIEENYVLGCDGVAGQSLLSRRGQAAIMIRLPDGTYTPSGDIGFEGVGLWFHGAENYISSNLVANAKTGITVWTRANGDARLHTFRDFSSNTVFYSSSALTMDGLVPTEPVVVDDFSAYGVASGISGSYSHLFEFNRPIVIGFGHNYTHAIDFNFLSKLTVRGGNIQLTDYGIMPRTNFEIVDTFFAKNRTGDILIANSNWTDTPGTTGIIRNDRHAASSTWISSTWGPVELHVPHVGFPRHVYVYDHNGVPGDDFELFMREQATDYVIKGAGVAGRKTPAEITNGELWTRYGVALGGQVATGATTRANIVGLVRALPGDMTPPTISNVTTEILSPTSVRIRWTTDEPATTALEYGKVLSDDYFGQFATPDNSLKTEHEVELTDLAAGSYAFRPYATDASGNTRYIIGEGSYVSRKVYEFKTI